MRQPGPKYNGRLLIVSNRLPITVKDDMENRTFFVPTSGGLASALSFLSESMEFKWFGWPGAEILHENETSVRRELIETYKAVPVLLDNRLGQDYYNGFSNSVLWPLLHYCPHKMHFNRLYWNAYRKANRIFAQTVASDLQNGDLVWIHDYHLMLLPAMLQQEIDGLNLDITISFFMHTPFPSSEIFKTLPVSHEILQGILQSHLIGFHTVEYARHFMINCACILNSKTSLEGVQLNERFVKVSSFPIGTEPKSMKEDIMTNAIQDQSVKSLASLKDIKIVLGVDRSDYIKGLPQKFQALDAFYRKYPEYIGKVLLIQIAVPTRQGVEEYRNLETSMSEQVGLLVGRYSNQSSTPVHYMHKSVDKADLSSLYAMSDVCLVSSIRDGMNLVAYEYIASQVMSQGVLVISEFTGAARVLEGSLVVNPWDTEGLADAIHRALSMNETLRSSRHETLQKHVRKHTSTLWGQCFLFECIKLVEGHEESCPNTEVLDRLWEPAAGFDGTRDSSFRFKSVM